MRKEQHGAVPVPYLKFRQGVVRPTFTSIPSPGPPPHPTPHAWIGGGEEEREEKMEVHTGKEKPAGTGALLAKAIEGDEPKVIPVF